MDGSLFSDCWRHSGQTENHGRRYNGVIRRPPTAGPPPAASRPHVEQAACHHARCARETTFSRHGAAI